MMYSPIDDDASPRRRRVAGGGLLACMGALLLLATARRQTNAAPAMGRLDATAAVVRSDAAAVDLSAAVGFETITIEAHDLLAHENVCYWVKESAMVLDCYAVPATLLYTLVPKKMVIKLQRSRVERSVGGQASDGFVAFNLVRQDRSGVASGGVAFDSSSWLIVLTLEGDIQTIVPFGTFDPADDYIPPLDDAWVDDDGYIPPPASEEGLPASRRRAQAPPATTDDLAAPVAPTVDDVAIPAPPAPFFVDDLVDDVATVANGATYYSGGGLKSWNDENFLIAAGADISWDGYLYKFDWRRGNWSKLVDVAVDAHDAQRAHSGDRVWVLLSSSTYEFGELEVSTGDADISTKIEKVAISGKDFNHLQLINDDAHAVISSRTDGSIYKVVPAADQSEQVWVLGGAEGEYDIVGLDGTVYPAGSAYWMGQHNAEYIGDDEYAMFDNNYPVGDSPTNNSRLLIVRLDPAAANATIVWEYDTNTKTEEFGDNDPLPTGNMLGCWFQSTQTFTVEDDYEAKIVEVVRNSSEIAWQLEVFGGSTCDSGNCLVNASWYMYSVERFFPRPLVYDVRCEDGFLSFTTQSTFKRSNAESGTYEIYDAATGSLLASTAFDFEAHWRPSYLNATAGVTDGLAGRVVVTNQFGTNRTVSFHCASSPA